MTINGRVELLKIVKMQTNKLKTVVIHAPIDVTELINHCSYGDLFVLCKEVYKNLTQIGKEQLLAENICDADDSTIINRYNDVMAII